MGTWTKIWRWALVALVAVGTILTVVLLLGRKKDPLGAVKREIESINAEEAAGIAEAEHGKKKALELVEAEYQDALQEMERESAERVAKLREDPKKLARALARKGRKTS